MGLDGILVLPLELVCDAESWLLLGPLRFARCFVRLLWWLASLAPLVVFAEQKLTLVENRTGYYSILYLCTSRTSFMSASLFLAPAFLLNSTLCVFTISSTCFFLGKFLCSFLFSWVVCTRSDIVVGHRQRRFFFVLAEQDRLQQR